MVFGFSTGIRAAYSVLDNPSFVAEPWYVYPAKHKSNGKHVSVHIFDKTKFELQIARVTSRLNTKNSRLIASETIELLKYEVSQLAKLRHPQILTVYEVLEETKLKLIFATELVSNTLLTVLVDKLDDITVQKGLLQISKGLQFLHNQCHVVHLNIQPASIFINDQGDWKVAGFRFSQNLNEISPEERDNFFIMNTASLVPFANHNLIYTAPELIITLTLKLDAANDLWSLGCLCFYLYNNGGNLISCFDSASISDYKTEFRKFEQKFYNHRPSELKYLLQDIPERFYPVLTGLLARYPHDRPSIDQFIDSDFFNGSVIKAMWIIDEFSTKLTDEKRIFLEGLLEGGDQGLLAQFPALFRTAKLLPVALDLIATEVNIANEKLANDELVCHALNIVFKIGESLSSLSFHDKIYQLLLQNVKTKKQDKSTFSKLLNYTVKTRLTLVQNMPVLQAKLNDRQLTDFLSSSAELFLTFASTEASHKQDQIALQDTFLAQLPLFVKKFDFPYLKNTFFPLVCQVFKTTTILSTKLTTVQVFLKYLQEQVIDRTIVSEQLLPVLSNLKSRDKRIIHEVLGLFAEITASEHIGLEITPVVETILPQCWKLAFDCNDCSKREFQQFMVVIGKMQKATTDKKIAHLPESSTKHYLVEANTPDFESMLSQEKINRNNAELMQKTPVAKVMELTRKDEKVGTDSKGSSKPAQRLRIKRDEEYVLRPRPKPKALTVVSASSASTPSQPALRFGATSNQNLMTKLDEWKVAGDDDEFDSFQQAGVGKIDWMTERTNNNSNNTSDNVSGHVSNNASHGLNTAGSNSVFGSNGGSKQPSTTRSPPPGFTNMVLTPNSTGRQTSDSLI